VGYGPVSNKKPLVSVVIPNLNGRDMLACCLRSLERQTFKDFEVIVVDNGSTDGSIEMVRSDFPWLEIIIENKTNTGFAKACNQGIDAGSGDLIALLNNDTEAHPDWLAELVRAAEKHPEAGMFATKTLLFDKRDTIDTAGHLIYRDGLNRGRGRLEIDRGQYDDKTDVFFPSGAAALYRRKMFDEIGLFDERHFAYGDDIDIGIRGRLAGWKCIFVPGAVVYHMYSATTGKYSPMKLYLVERNRLWIVLKYLPMKYVLLNLFYTKIRYLYHFYGIVRGQGASGRSVSEHSFWELASTVYRAYWDALKGFPRVWRERKRMMKLKKVTDREIDRWFGDYGISAKEIALRE
jgi:GT2 family glycosyltransferase